MIFYLYAEHWKIFLRMKEVEKVTMLTDEKLTQEELEKEDNISRDNCN